MQLEMASALAEEHQREMARRATRLRAAHAARGADESFTDVHETGAAGWRLPRYRVRWSRTTLPAIGTAGRRERSWVIVISATRGL
jgi:hypothetical protein